MSTTKPSQLLLKTSPIAVKITFRGVKRTFFSGVPLVKFVLSRYCARLKPQKQCRVAQFRGKTVDLATLNMGGAWTRMAS